MVVAECKPRPGMHQVIRLYCAWSQFLGSEHRGSCLGEQPRFSGHASEEDGGDGFEDQLEVELKRHFLDVFEIEGEFVR